MRLYDEKRKPFNFNHIIIFTDITNKNIKIKIEVLNIHIFLSFYELYSNFDKIFLGYDENELSDPLDMEQYYTKENIIKYSVIGIELRIKK